MGLGHNITALGSLAIGRHIYVVGLAVAALGHIADNANNEPYAADYARDLLKGEVDANKP
jgi:hypothetical protein